METLTATETVDAYVARLGRALRGPGRLKRDMLAEARDSLLDAAEAYRADGLDRDRAERLAIEDFGPVDVIAPGYQEELTAGQGRRTAAVLFVTVPFTALMWSAIWHIFPAAETAAKPAWFGGVAVTVDYLQLTTGLLSGLVLFALRRGRRTRVLTRSLGLLVLGQMPVMAVLCSALVWGSRHAVDLASYPPGTVATYLSIGLWAWQLWCASRCLRFSAKGTAPAV
ncbi:hypothetical protein Aph01nite_20770 [Acrocarpospora phusangensis]|uniref:Uncharacterized protein n=1 Tax=Acrocarpospora phusangensis TaxID=1070424 RepID=A0A919Q7J7_9ACTN|nr:permease prefix domain 1-containing protein [Acrocarpospora phusangensis]GIH23767.1 hypothetical protein Aph01nite_20770 [Acrocarpospora phusangensis]